MSQLRRRVFGSLDAGSQDSRAPSPAPVSKDEYSKVPSKKLEKINKHLTKRSGSSKRRNAWIFGLGGLFGVLIAVFFAGSNEMIDLTYLRDMGLDTIMESLPAGIIRDAKALQKNERDAVAYDSFAVGLHAREEGVSALHPVIMIPGVISTGLESWGTESEHSRTFFRRRLWGSWSMMRALVLDQSSWLRHLMLDKYTGLDPPGIKLRAAQGFDAADFFITGYWIWNKILENLATIGYDPSNAFTAAYDWRLAYANLEVRDQYFSRLKSYIETAVRVKGQKVVLLSHSMGSQVLFYFYHWVEAEGAGFGNGGPRWVEEHIDSWINISGCMLGTSKGLPAVLSGEMKDTAQLNALAVYGLEKFLSRADRVELLRAMPGISSMLPLGGNAIWGNATWAPDDRPGQAASFGAFLTFRATNTSAERVLAVDDALPYLLDSAEDWYADAVRKNYSHGVAHSEAEVERNQRVPAKWMNPLETRLPWAPSLKIYCFYGVGKPTERSYFYRGENDPKVNVTIDTTVNGDGSERGVVMGEGDGTVSLISTGYMCNKGWRMKRYNPGGVQIKVYEMPHEPDRFSPRGGPNTADHVDILGRSSLNDLILRVAGGKGHLINETIHSNIKEYADKVQIWDD